MISIRKHIDNFAEAVSAAPRSHTAASLQPAPIDALHSVLEAMGECGERAVPSLGDQLRRKLAEVQRQITPGTGAVGLANAGEQIRQELSAWADGAQRHHNDNEREIREIIGVVARAAETVGKKDEKYSREIGELTGKMRQIADMRDLALIRRAIIENATQLKSCVERMAEDGKASTRQLTAEIEEYRAKLAESEKAALVDPLTQLANRRAFERKLESLMAGRTPFCLIMADLDEFKKINDQYGHAAGDDLLRQFGTELKGQFPPTDMVCRWGGDEFAVLAAGRLKDAQERVEGIRRWVLGEYKLSVGNAGTEAVIKVATGASIGAVEWNQTESAAELLARADQGLYAGKGARLAARIPGVH